MKTFILTYEGSKHLQHSRKIIALNKVQRQQWLPCTKYFFFWFGWLNSQRLDSTWIQLKMLLYLHFNYLCLKGCIKFRLIRRVWKDIFKYFSLVFFNVYATLSDHILSTLPRYTLPTSLFYPPKLMSLKKSIKINLCFSYNIERVAFTWSVVNLQDAMMLVR